MYNEERLKKLAKEIHENAVKHGWHEKKLSPEHYLCLVITEVSEAVEADRKNMRADLLRFELTRNQENFFFNEGFNAFIKDTVDDELADVVIRLLDMANEIYGDNIPYYLYGHYNCYDRTFPEVACFFVKEVLNSGIMNIVESVRFVYDWAEHLGIDLDKHIALKMRYNSLRTYKHGGKKY